MKQKANESIKIQHFVNIFFRIIKAIKMPKFASISQILSKFCHFFEFSSFFLPNVDRLRCFMGFFKELEPTAIIFVKKVIFD